MPIIRPGGKVVSNMYWHMIKCGGQPAATMKYNKIKNGGILRLGSRIYGTLYQNSITGVLHTYKALALAQYLSQNIILSPVRKHYNRKLKIIP